MNPYIYLRVLKHVDFSVFCVQDGQKTYYDPQFGVRVPYSSGQQVKRSILTSLMDTLNVLPAPTTFVFNGKNAKEGEVLSLCDPRYPDQLLGGWMFSIKKGDERTRKRRSPLSISAMRPLHPLLANVPDENISFDRSDMAQHHKVIVRDENGQEMSEKDIKKLLDGTDRSLYRKWIPYNKRATGLFVYDVAIDLRTLFCISMNPFEPEVKDEVAVELREQNWIESENVFGKCLVMPKEQRDKIIPVLANALLNWRITSNQARTFSLMETLAIAISDNANTLASSIRAKLRDAGESPKASPVIDENAGANLFVLPACSAYVLTECDSPDAIRCAEQKLIDIMNVYDFENQLNR